MRYLVTGGAGLIGSHLCEALIKLHGHTVICVDSGVIGRRRNIEHLLRYDNFILEWKDILDNDFDIGPVDGIYHLASPTAPAETYKHSDLTVLVNSGGVLKAIAWAEKYCAKLLFASSVKVHDRLNFGAAYIQGKILGEKYCEEAKFPKVARMGNVYGPKMAIDDSRVIPTFCRNVRDGKPLSVWGDGQQIDSFCYVTDAVSALIKLMDSEHIGVFEIGSPEGITIYDLALETISATGAEVPIEFAQPGGGSVVVCNNLAYSNNRTCAALLDKNRKVPNISNAVNYLRWKPETTLKDGIKKTFEYYKTIGE